MEDVAEVGSNTDNTRLEHFTSLLTLTGKLARTVLKSEIAFMLCQMTFTDEGLEYNRRV